MYLTVVSFNFGLPQESRQSKCSLFSTPSHGRMLSGLGNLRLDLRQGIQVGNFDACAGGIALSPMLHVTTVLLGLCIGFRTRNGRLSVRSYRANCNDER